MIEDPPDIGTRWRTPNGDVYELTQLARRMEEHDAPWYAVLCEDDADGRAWVCTLELLLEGIYFQLVEENEGIRQATREERLDAWGDVTSASHGTTTVGRFDPEESVKESLTRRKSPNGTTGPKGENR